MLRRGFLYALGGFAASGINSGFLSAFSETGQPSASNEILGMYLHAAWPYNRPYAARSWTIEDWRGYADGLKKLGFNTLIFWPVVETMGSPLTPSDRASLEKIAKVIHVLHQEFGMRFWMTLCPNVAVKNAEAAKDGFAQRHLFYSDMRVNPGDATAVRAIIKNREDLLRPCSQMDALIIG